MRASVSHRSLEGVVEQRKLRVPPDQRSGERTDRAALASGRRHRAPDRHRLGKTAQLPRAGRLELEGMSREPVGHGTDEDLVRLGGLLETRGEVDGPPGRERQLGILGEDLSGLDADAALEPEPADRCTDLEGRPQCSLGVILVGQRNSERGHHRVACKRLDGAAVCFDAARDELEELRHATAHDLGVGGGDECRRPDEVDEDDRCELSFDTASMRDGAWWRSRADPRSPPRVISFRS
jgi:hypothetical protein